MDERTDEALVAETLAGNRDAFACLVRKYQDYVYATAVGILSDFELARDVAQEAFLCAFRDLQRLREPSRFGGWLHGIVHRTAGTALREMARGRVLSQELHRIAATPDSAPAPDRAAEEAEVHAIVRRALARLSEDNREVVCLHYVDGLSYTDIAGYLGVTKAAVQGRLQRARGKLRKELTMIDNTLKNNAQDDRFARRVARAIEIYTAKGPSESSIGSDWEKTRIAQTGEILRLGDEGFRIDVELSRSGNPRIRAKACLHFHLRGDSRAVEHVLRLMQDDVPGVRRAALGAYASLIHPEGARFYDLGTPTHSVPEGIERVLPFLRESSIKTRMAALRILAAYVKLGDPRVENAFRCALDDPKHRIRHSVASVLGVACPGCGAKPMNYWGPAPSPEAPSSASVHAKVYQKAAETMRPGEEGFEADVAQSFSPKSRDRRTAVISLAVRDDPRCKEHLQRLLHDENAKVRRQALSGYAALIHPSKEKPLLERIGDRAGSVPDGIEVILPSINDSNTKNRMVTVWILADYAGLGHPRVQDTLRKALDDPHHKVRHAAARALRTECPDCGTVPED